MIKGLHGMFYTSKPEAMRRFLRDKLRLPHIDTGGGWLLFAFPEADVGCHPTDPSGGPASGTHDVSFFCDDIRKTVAELRRRGVKFDDSIEDHGYGLVTHFTMPGGVRVQLYEPKYDKPSRLLATEAASGRRNGLGRKAPSASKAVSAKLASGRKTTTKTVRSRAPRPRGEARGC